jgi:hypothetical protein
MSTHTVTLSKAAEKLAFEAAQLRRDVTRLLEFFGDVPIEAREPPEAADEKTLEASLFSVRAAARSICACERDLSFIRNTFENADLSALFRRD